ncbi:histidinol dehydrogenase [Paenibacillus soyae]|uniref:Histidinol dehydrogenase n=1 Tax=Paenibacillus soyae TaxID=2969249 RepID=A0A9X2MPL4_9BACL|nr:histidinol dehydrogenase [Paenibacillus soyae]MCR2805888.1 histidinol dehydrogenase [Paenibacillus soyae]
MQNRQLIYRIPEQARELAERYKSHKTLFDRTVLSGVLAIFDEVGADGDEAIKRRTLQHDQVELKELALSEAYAKECVASLKPAMRDAVERAIRHVAEVNREMLPASWEKEIRPGTIIGEKVSPLDAVGIWVPARKGPLVSTAIMLVTAAKTAGVKRIIVGMPPLANGLGDPGTVAAATLAGADQFVVGNGVSIIAAFAQGTSTVPEVDGIFGPGPGGIAAALSMAMTYGKKSVLGIGPTESIILADETADSRLTAYDLLNEAEHGPDSSAILVTPSSALAEKVEAMLRDCIEETEEPRRTVLRQVFGPDGKGAIIIAPDWNASCDWINAFAPEHLLIKCAKMKEELALSRIRHAGELLIGEYTPFSAANYGIGITAVLPTNHFAKAFSGVTSRDMVKQSTIGRLEREALAELYPIIRELGTYEQLPCHVRAADKKLREQ